MAVRLLNKRAKKANVEISERKGYWEKIANMRFLNRSSCEKIAEGARDLTELLGLGAELCAGELLPLLAVPELGFERRLLVQLQHVLALHGLRALLNLYKLNY